MCWGEVLIEEVEPIECDRMLQYSEEVEVSYNNGTKGSGRQTYTFRLKNMQGELHQYTAENAHMFQLDFQKNEGTDAVARGSHLCGNDTYNVLYYLYVTQHMKWKCLSFKCVYGVKGPEKDYTTDTMFSRIG